MKSRFHQLNLNRSACACVLLLAASYAWAESAPTDAGRLFYTAAQRAQLEAARARNVNQATQATQATQPAYVAPPPTVRFDGVVIRSDGKRTTWVNGQQQPGAPGAAGLKPGQIRSDGKVYEPYQLLRRDGANAAAEGPTP